jgi:hypothetical protein
MVSEAALQRTEIVQRLLQGVENDAGMRRRDIRPPTGE